MKTEGKTTEELLALQANIENNPSNRNDGVYLYTPKARKKLDAIREQITYNIAVKRAAAGKPVKVCGFSGRLTKKR